MLLYRFIFYNLLLSVKSDFCKRFIESFSNISNFIPSNLTYNMNITFNSGLVTCVDNCACKMVVHGQLSTHWKGCHISWTIEKFHRKHWKSLAYLNLLHPIFPHHFQILYPDYYFLIFYEIFEFYQIKLFSWWWHTNPNHSR